MKHLPHHDTRKQYICVQTTEGGLKLNMALIFSCGLLVDVTDLPPQEQCTQSENHSVSSLELPAVARTGLAIMASALRVWILVAPPPVLSLLLWSVILHLVCG